MATLGEARDSWFSERGLPLDGGYQKRWVPLKLGPIPFAIPNTRARKEAVPLHDLHHLLTGYKTDWAGEFEISAWEIAAGCGRYSFAWMINLKGLVAGAVVFPLRTWRAWVRGRLLGQTSETLYNYAEYSPELLDSPVDEWRTKLGLACLSQESPAIFLPLYLAAVVLGLASILGPLAAFALAAWYAWTRWIT